MIYDIFGVFFKEILYKKNIAFYALLIINEN